MSELRSRRFPQGRRRRQVALAAALLLTTEAALLAGRSAVAAPAAEPEDGKRPATATATANNPSAKDVLASDLAWAAKHAEGSKAWALLRAEKTGGKVTVTDETTETSRTVANPDGTFTTELTPGPERVWRDGKWRKADATLVADADGGVFAKMHPAGLRLAGKGGTRPTSLRAAQSAGARDLVTLGSGREQVTLQWKGGLPKPELDGTRARYHDAVPGADVIVEATRTGFEQFVEVAERPAHAYSYTLPVRAEGLKAEANGDGSVTFRDARTGAARAEMPAPVMWDASVDERSGEHTHRARVGMKVLDKGAGGIDLVVTPSEDFLNDPDTVYPVTIDPSTSALASTFDTYVQQGETVDWSGDAELDLGNPGTRNADGTPRTARSFITWNTSAIQDALIVDTNLALWNFHSGNTDCSAQSWTVWDTSASSTSSRWTSQPTWNQQYHSSTQTKGSPDCAATQPDGWINADVDALVQTWASAKATRGHMGLRAATDDVKAWKRVNSANATSNQPKLSVTYNYRPSDGTARQAGPPFKSYGGVWAVDSTTPTLRDTVTDPDGDKVNVTFQVYDAATNTPITTPAGEGLIVSGFVDSGKPASVTVPAGQLRDGRTYKFRTNAYDGTHYNLSWSSWTQFVVDTTAPGEPQSIVSSTYPENWGGPSGVAGGFDVTTGAPDAAEVRFRVDPYEDDPATHGWSTVRTTTGTTRALAPDAAYTVIPTADGNHAVETQTVDRAGNAGPIKDYGFTSGTRDYNRPQKIDIALPPLDKDALAPNQPNSPQAAGIPGFKPLSAPRTVRSENAEVTITPKKRQSLEGTRASARARMTRAASYPDPVITDAWCQPSLYGEAQKSLMSRTEACLFYDLHYTAKATFSDGTLPVEYSAHFEVAYQIKVDVQGNSIKTWIELNPISNSFPAEDRAVLFGDGNPNAMIDNMCFSDGCATDGGDRSQENFDFYNDLSWDGGMEGNQPRDTHMATGTASHTWNGSVDNASGSRDVDLSKTMPVYFIANPETEVTPPMGLNGKRGEWEDRGPGTSPWVYVRCDKVPANGATSGCVLPQYYPKYTFNTAKYPAAAAHVWLIQNKSKVNGSGKSIYDPLRYLPSKARNETNYERDYNRDRVMCPKYTGPRMDGWVPQKRFAKHKWTALHPEIIEGAPETISCDEFPFSSTYQSPGVPVVNGGTNTAGKNGGAECIQTVAAKTDDGSEHLLDDTRYDAPTFDEKCGRSSMSLKVNSGSMETDSFYEGFLKKFRILDQDSYYVDPGNSWFAGCDPTKATLVCTMAKP
ncbi:DNRLRE domain-containing protein [Streptomyces sp. DH24]|uniref:DNRLRE domain-containing protein n=1 Tax=Streptomyces sp. DH24 TaxID=3040123 RepID=UPI002442D339|nr:DNRLRE domain-containing protein [Streptomyces sp. DH24]MDG9717253.1 DNRLRE domain-containing protein [Streptomyces sp. DH24]